MVRTILIPLDGSEFSERVLAHVPAIGRTEALHLVLVQVLELERSIAYTSPDMVHVTDFTRWRRDAEIYLQRWADELRSQGYRVSTTVAEGGVVSSLCRVAKSQNVDLIAMTTHGRSGLGRWLLGSVAQRVVQSAHLPVYLVRPGHEGAFIENTPGARGTRIVVPLDGSELAEKALPVAIEWAATPDQEAVLWLVQAVEMPNLWVDEFMAAEAISPEPSTVQQVALARAYLAAVAERIATPGLRIYTHVAIGAAADVVSSVVEDEAIDIVVMRTHARKGFDRLILGSVAEQVLRTANCPLLLVPPDADDADRIEGLDTAASLHEIS